MWSSKLGLRSEPYVSKRWRVGSPNLEEVVHVFANSLLVMTYVSRICAVTVARPYGLIHKYNTRLLPTQYSNSKISDHHKSYVLLTG